jgi:hypothetical protein
VIECAALEAGVRMGYMNELIGAATLVVTAVGLWFAYNYSRQMALKLSETRLEAYSRLWETRSRRPYAPGWMGR